MIISAQDLRNAYEKFYTKFREYLWPFGLLENLANAEVEIYTAFPDKTIIELNLSKLRSAIADASKDYKDEELQSEFDALVDLVEELDTETTYHIIQKVEEVNPDEDKQIKSTVEEDNSEGESTVEEVYSES